MLDWLLDPILGPLLRLEPIIAILIISVTISFVISIVYKKFTNQSLMRELKSEIKELQKQMKTLKDKPDEMMKVNKRAMEANMKYMSHSMRPTLITFIPIIIIFGWLNAHMAYYPLVENQQFTSTFVVEDDLSGTVRIDPPDAISIVKGGSSQEIADNKAEWVLKGDAGEYIITYEFRDNEYRQDVILVESRADRNYAEPVARQQDPVKEIRLSNERIEPLSNIPLINLIPWVNERGWLFTYIVLSIISSITIRKWLKIY
jgi:uncharacterized membrane protein (DUF106 family)